MKRLLLPGGTRFVICGVSGSGKSRAIELANDSLPENEQIAESRELTFESSVIKAIETLHDLDLAYEVSMHIGFCVYEPALAKSLEQNGEKVFWL